MTDAFRRRYVLPSGRMTSDSPTACAVAVAFGLPGPRRRQAAGDRLAEPVLADDARIATGFVGTPLICDALTDTGHRDVAYRLLLQTVCQSWLHPVTMGATTIWERWDGSCPDGTLDPGGIAWARTRHETPHGTAALSWELTAAGMTARTGGCAWRPCPPPTTPAGRGCPARAVRSAAVQPAGPEPMMMTSRMSVVVLMPAAPARSPRSGPRPAP